MRKGLLFAKRSWRMGKLRECKFFLSIIFLLRQNDVVPKEIHTLLCPEDEIFEFFFSNEKRSLSERKKTQRFHPKDKAEYEFPEGPHHFAKGEK